MNKPSPLSKATIVVWVIWAALMMAVVVYMYVLKVVYAPRPADAPPLDTRLPLVLGGVAVFLGLMSLVVRGLFLGKLKAGVIPLDSPGATRIYITGHIIAFAFAESVSVFGLIVGFLGYPLDLAMKFMLGALALLIWHVPLVSRVTPES